MADMTELKNIVRLGTVQSVNASKMTARVKFKDKGGITSGDLRIIKRPVYVAVPIRGSSFNNTSNGGAGALNLNNPRSNVNNNVSFRSASPHFCQQSCSQVGTSSAYGLKGFISIPKAASREP